jgi:hypothetical protein
MALQPLWTLAAFFIFNLQTVNRTPWTGGSARRKANSSQVVTRPLERVFIVFVGPIVRSRRGNIAVLVVLDGFSKFIAMYPVRKITSGAKYTRSTRTYTQNNINTE